MRLNLSRRLLLACAVVWILPIAGCSHPASERTTVVDDAALQAADGDNANWLTYGRTYSEQRFSPLKQLNEETVGKLGLAWSYNLGTMRGEEATPIVKDGVMYASSAWSTVYALDVWTGTLLWKYDPQVPKDHDKYVCCDVVNRGVALYKGRVYVGTLDGRLVALDAVTGAPDWIVETTPKDGSYAITGAPRIAKGRVLIGNAGSEYPVRGYLSAYDADTGKLAWRTYTVPGDPSQPFESDAMKQAAATWSGEWWKAGGGGTVWDSIVYDPELDQVYFGTGNGSPWYERIRSKGDNLYIASIIAVRADNGQQVWHYQTTPGDSWDYDATQPLMLATLSIDGAQRRVVMQANKNGFFYVIDRENGKLISARPYAPMNWATGVDSNGRPIENAAARQFKDAALVQPSAEGAHNWNPMSYSPLTGLVYLPVLHDTTLHAVIPNWKIDLHDQTTGYDRAYHGPVREQYLKMKSSGELLAWDPVAQKEAWHVDMPDPKSGGTLATAGNLVFQGRSDGELVAYQATDGKPLWQFDAGVGYCCSSYYLFGERRTGDYGRHGMGRASGACKPSCRQRQRWSGENSDVHVESGDEAPCIQARSEAGSDAHVQACGFALGNRAGRRAVCQFLLAMPWRRRGELRRGARLALCLGADARNVRGNSPGRGAQGSRHAVVRRRLDLRASPLDPRLHPGTRKGIGKVEQTSVCWFLKDLAGSKPAGERCNRDPQLILQFRENRRVLFF